MSVFLIDDCIYFSNLNVVLCFNNPLQGPHTTSPRDGILRAHAIML